MLGLLSPLSGSHAGVSAITEAAEFNCAVFWGGASCFCVVLMTAPRHQRRRAVISAQVVQMQRSMCTSSHPRLPSLTLVLHRHPYFPDLFAAGFGSYDFMQQSSGLVYCYSLKNTSFPEFMFATKAGVMCLDFHPQHHSLLCVGCYDGTVLVFDARQKSNRPLYESSVQTGKHHDPVWQVQWQEEDLSKVGGVVGPPRALRAFVLSASALTRCVCCRSFNGGSMDHDACTCAR